MFFKSISRATLVSGSVFYVLFIAQFWRPTNFFLYGASALLGVGAALVWTAQVMMTIFFLGAGGIETSSFYCL